MQSCLTVSGPTGVGKTELARRVATLSHSPFLKVEATKYTEVGFRGQGTQTYAQKGNSFRRQ